MIIEILIDKNLSFKQTSKYVDVDYYQIDGKENYILKNTVLSVSTYIPLLLSIGFSMRQTTLLYSL